jgi:hypothetical protein
LEKGGLPGLKHFAQPGKKNIWPMCNLAIVAAALLLALFLSPALANDPPPSKLIGTWEIDAERTLQESRKNPAVTEADGQKLYGRIRADAERLKIQITDTNFIYKSGMSDSPVPYSLVSSIETGMTVSTRGPNGEVVLVFSLIDETFMNMRSAAAASDPVNYYFWRKVTPVVYAVSPPSPETVAQSFSFPGVITYTDEMRKECDFDNAGKRIWARYYQNASNTFASTAVILYEGGTHLNAERRRQLENGLADYKLQMEKIRQDAMQHGRSDPSKNRSTRNELDEAPIRFFDLADKRRGYAFVAAVGPGGGAIAASLSSKDGKYDLMVVIDFPDESGRFNSSETTKEYRESLKERPFSSLQQAITKLDSVMFP